MSRNVTICHKDFLLIQVDISYFVSISISKAKVKSLKHEYISDLTKQRQVLRGDVPPAETDKSELLEEQDQTIIKPVTDLVCC